MTDEEVKEYEAMEKRYSPDLTDQKILHLGPNPTDQQILKLFEGMPHGNLVSVN